MSGDSCQAVHSFHLFNKLFKECRDVFISLTTESCNYLTEAHKGIVSKLIVVIEIIMNQWECPLVFMDQKVSCLFPSNRYILWNALGDNWSGISTHG